MLCYSNRRVTLSRVLVFLAEEFNSYVNNMLFEIAKSMLCYSDRKVTFGCVLIFFSEEFNSYVKSTLMGLKC